ncbi:hypothetical protein [Peribacillus frigoritolerans]|uniref:hypothetical protein n=1 Tax=Peribacillus frigoritolerans TaxID=450367 RepID=UPI0010706DEC|nr:hypothetical protein [Peribacillus frigoritolerans]TFH62636.1 hypothetical protein E4J71_02200 [Peribacillus frigoritolerans]
MKKRFILFALVFALFTTTFTPLASAKQIGINGQNVSQTSEEDQIRQLAKDFEFIFEEAAIKNSEGELVGFDEGKMEERFGSGGELDEFMETSQVLAPEENNAGISVMSSRNDEVNACFNKKVKNGYMGIVTGAVLGEIWNLLMDGKYLEGAKKAAKAGVKGSVQGIMGTLMIYLFNCVNK